MHLWGCSSVEEHLTAGGATAPAWAEFTARGAMCWLSSCTTWNAAANPCSRWAVCDLCPAGPLPFSAGSMVVRSFCYGLSAERTHTQRQGVNVALFIEVLREGKPNEKRSRTRILNVKEPHRGLTRGEKTQCGVSLDCGSCLCREASSWNRYHSA